jgi:polyketide cyclase/dehydrase/lipid transport protein
MERGPVMVRYLATITSRRPAEETFAYLSTFSNAADWAPGVLSAQQLDPGPVQRGTRFRLVVPFLGRQLTMSYENILLRPGFQTVGERAAAGLAQALAAPTTPPQAQP